MLIALVATFDASSSPPALDSHQTLGISSISCSRRPSSSLCRPFYPVCLSRCSIGWWADAASCAYYLSYPSSIVGVCSLFPVCFVVGYFLLVLCGSTPFCIGCLMLWNQDQAFGFLVLSTFWTGITFLVLFVSSYEFVRLTLSSLVLLFFTWTQKHCWFGWSFNESCLTTFSDECCRKSMYSVSFGHLCHPKICRWFVMISTFLLNWLIGSWFIFWSKIKRTNLDSISCCYFQNRHNSLNSKNYSKELSRILVWDLIRVGHFSKYFSVILPKLSRLPMVF